MSEQLVQVTDVKATLGEGPIWYREQLYWVDIIEKRVYIYNPSLDSVRHIQLDKMVGTVVPRSAGGLVVALEDGFYAVDERDGEATLLASAEADNPSTRFNDGKCDPVGRLWAGTMGLKGEKGIGALYMLDAERQVHTRLTDVTISNGICWSHDHTTMYYIDTPTQEVVAFAYDNKTGEISDRRVVVTFDRSEGGPDGMTIDAEGNLWVALWGGWAVVCVDPNSGERLHKVDVPCAHVTACAFGGEGLTDLYITTARTGVDEDALKEQPLAGALFKTSIPSVRGVPSMAYAG